MSVQQVIKQSIFRAYDIRGVVDEELSEKTVYLIGKAYGSEVLNQGDDTAFIARDGRLSGPILLKALEQGIRSTGCNVIDLGCVPTPLLYFATYYLSELSRSGVMLTGSHNPKNYNGLKMVINQKSVSEDAIQNLYQRIISNHLVNNSMGDYSQKNIIEDYLNNIAEQIKLNNPIKIVVDAGNGVPGLIAPKLYKKLGCEVECLYCDVDGNFPNHHPDPSKPKNLEDLILKVKSSGADMGFAFDGDGDRLGLVTPKGKIIWPDRQMMLYAQGVLKNNPNAQIIYDVKCSKFLADIIKQSGGEPLMYKTGHSLVKQKLKETGAPLAGEMSGHIFFNDKWYGFDDALYTGARLLELFDQKNQNQNQNQKITLDQLFEQLPEGVSTPEINVSIADEDKFKFIESVCSEYLSGPAENSRLLDIDGARIEFEDCWGLVRASNTTPCLVLRFEAKSQEQLNFIQNYFLNLIHQVDQTIAELFKREIESE